jgi:hypothetical protein
MKIRSMLILIGLLLIALVPITHDNSVLTTSVIAIGSTYYASNAGSDINPGTLLKPWKTIKKAFRMLHRGDTLMLRGGTYIEKVSVTGIQGTSDAWITVKPYNSEKVIINGGSLFGLGIFQFGDGCKFIRVTGLEFTKANYAGIYISNGEITDIKIDNCSINNCQSSGVYAYSNLYPTKCVRRIEFAYNKVTNVNNGKAGSPTWSPQEAISYSGVIGGSIHHNTLSKYGKEGIDCKSGTSDVLVHHNNIDTSSDYPAFQWSYNHIGIYIDGYSRLNKNIDIYDNKITGYGGAGIILNAEHPESGGKIEDIRVFNNIIALSYKVGHEHYRGIDSLNDCQWKDVSIFSNTIYTNGLNNAVIRIFPSASHIINLVIANNIFAGGSYYTLSFQKMTSTEAIGRVTMTNNIFFRYGGSIHNIWKNGIDKSWGVNAILKDPKFVSKDTANLNLLIGSPAINAGQLATASSKDYNDVLRPKGIGVDIGAFEYV